MECKLLWERGDYRLGFSTVGVGGPKCDLIGLRVNRNIRHAVGGQVYLLRSLH